MTEKLPSTPEDWEKGPLGKDPQFASALSPEQTAEDLALIEEAFGLKPISIRLEAELLESLKAIAKNRGLGYQPLIRQVLHRFVDCELKQIALEKLRDESDVEVKVEMPSGFKEAA